MIEEGGAVVFRADRADGACGIYASDDGSVRTIAEIGDVFETLGPFPSADGSGTVAFAATLRAGGCGVFLAREGSINPVVDLEDAFASYRGALVGGAGTVIRIATPRAGSLGLFAGLDPQGDRILAIGDPLFGSTVAAFAANHVSINAAGFVAVRATLTDGRELILRADPDG